MRSFITIFLMLTSSICATYDLADFKETAKYFVKSVNRFTRKVGQFIGYNEGCNHKWINTDKEALKSLLINEVFGQEIAHLEIPEALHNHWKNEHSGNIFLCFYGSPGTGKTYVTKLINKHMFYRGDKSYFYHFYNGAHSHITRRGLAELKAEMFESISDAVKECPYSIIVFDEADKYPHGFLDTLLAPIIKETARNSFGTATFIFLTNIGKDEVINKALEMYNSFFSSNTISAYQPIIDKLKIESKDSFFSSKLVQERYINNFIPFLPHTRTSFTQCFLKAIESFSIYSEDATNIQRQILHKVELIPKSQPTYVNSGCKHITSIIAREINRLIRKRRNEL